jgi:hypothetical protein
MHKERSTMTTHNPMFPPAPADRATSPSIVPFPGTANRTTRRKALLGILAGGLAAGTAGALAFPGGTTGPAAGTALGGLPTSLAGHDAELIALGAQLEAAWKDQNRAELALDYRNDPLDPAAIREFERTRAIASAIVDTIEATSARTLAGLRVKARAISWCHCGEAIELTDEQTTDIRLAQTMIADLLAVPVAPQDVKPDPIFAAIEAHRAAVREWEAVGLPGMEEGATPEETAECDRTGEACDRACAAFQRTQPTTMAGVIAALRHAANDEYSTIIDGWKGFPLLLVDAVRNIEGGRNV